MATTNFSSIAQMFKSPEQIIAEENEKQKAMIAERMRANNQSGAGLGPFQSLVQAWGTLTDLPMMAKEDPTNNPLYNKAVDREYILSSYAEQDLTKPETLRSLIKNLQTRGHMAEALAFAGQLQAIEQGQNEAVTAFSGMVNGKRVPLTYDKATGAYKYRKDGKLVDYDGDIEYKPSSLDPVKEEVAARLRSQRTGGGTGTTTGNQPVQMGKDGRPTGRVNPANLPPPAAGGITPQQALAQAEALRKKQQAIMEAERARIREGMTPGPVTEGQIVAP